MWSRWRKIQLEVGCSTGDDHNNLCPRLKPGLLDREHKLSVRELINLQVPMVIQRSNVVPIQEHLGLRDIAVEYEAALSQEDTTAATYDENAKYKILQGRQ